MVDTIRKIEEGFMRADVPDFGPGDTVRAHVKVVEGTRDAKGVFCADTLMTKCASKYESGGEAPHADPHLKNQADAAGSIVPNTAKAGSRG